MTETCKACGKELTSFVTVKENKYHPECFKCVKCNETVAGKAYVEKDGQFYCENDYYETFGVDCGHCEEKIKGQYVEALGKCWHQDHFVCSGCGGQFEGDQFRKHEERPWHEDCYLKEVADACTKCTKPIKDKMFEAAGGKYHEECFVCSEGDHKIGEGEQYFNYEQKLLCSQHMAEKLQAFCHVCRKPVSGEYLKMDTYIFHKECWKCSVCNTKLTTEAANCGKHEQGQFLCKPCNSSGKAIPPPAAAAGGAAGGAAGAGGAGGAAAAAGGGAGGAGGAGGGAGGTSDSKSEEKSGNLQPDVCYSLEALQCTKSQNPASFDFKNREKYLPDDQFFKVFAMTKAQFAKLPAWRRKMKKQEAGLF